MLLTRCKKSGKEVPSKNIELIIRATTKNICTYIINPISRQEIDQTLEYGDGVVLDIDIACLWLIGIEPCMYITQ